MSRKIGFWAVFAIVTGSQIGSGILMLPVSLAPFGIYGVLGWLFSGMGAIMLALVFANLCQRFPRTGGPHVYVQETFGNTVGFFAGWTYWLISWVSTPIVITSSVGYLSPVLGVNSHLFNLVLELVLLFIITTINLKGVKTAGKMEFVLTLLKFIPLLVVPIAALSLFDIQHFTVTSQEAGQTPTKMIFYVTLLTLWGFIGVESATTPAGSVENPAKTIPRAVIFGTLSVALLYFINSVSIMGAMPGKDLMQSSAPYADIARLLFKGNWHLVISLIAAIVCIGTLNAWTLASGQIALGLAEDGLFPKFLGKCNQHGAPRNAHLIACAGIIPILVLTMSDSLAEQVNAIIDFSVAAFLFVYAICCLAYLKMLWHERQKTTFIQWCYSIGAFVFCLVIIISTPINTLGFATCFVICGIPLYFSQRYMYLDKIKRTRISSRLPGYLEH